MDWQSIADRLIDEGLLVTALELHAELSERGKKIQSLEEFFRDSKHLKPRLVELPPESPSASCASFSQITLDDLSRYSEDSRTKIHDRVAVLEFELRRAKETIDGLRKELTESVLHSKSSHELNSAEMFGALHDARKLSKASHEDFLRDDTPLDGPLDEEEEEEMEIRGHEQKILNYLVNEYLLQMRYKLTAITFSEENSEEDFEDWDSIGLNIAKPPNLLTVFRKFNRYALKYKKDNRAKGCQTDENILQDIIQDTMNQCSMEMTKMKEERQKQLMAFQRQETELITVNCLLEEYKYRVSELEAKLSLDQQ